MSPEPRRGLGSRTARARRPSGEPEPLPREPFAGSAKIWIALAVVTAAIFALLISATDFVLGTGAFWDDVDAEFVDAVAAVRTDVLTPPARAINYLTDAWFLRVLRWGAVAALIAFKRWRHLAAFVGLILVVQPLTAALAYRMARPRADGIEILAPWSEFSSPSLPMTALIITLVGMTYAFAVGGKLRRRVLLAASGLITLVGMARLYLAVDRMTDALSATLFATAVTVLAFRIWAPDAVFPVSYSRRRVAHLELTPRRRDAIFTALHDQLGLPAVDVEFFGLEASGGSTPLLITLDGVAPARVFAKLYAQNHLRSDRFYKLGRSLLYGALEDETPFGDVRALAEREDYIMRLMEAAGVPGPASYGIVEITRGRENLLVAEFIEDATEISRAEVGDEVVDKGLAAIRAMWDAGLAHRDIKPGNVLVRGDDIFLIDVAFGETRPSPWREAVDLANMMLTLALRSSPKAVYEAALRHFTADEIAEAFASTRGVTIPSELKRALNDDPRDLVAEFRRLAPDRDQVRIQRWTRRRLGLLATSASMAVATLWLVAVNLSFVSGLL